MRFFSFSKENKKSRSSLFRIIPRKKIHQSKGQNSKIRKWWKICSKIERLEVYYFPRKEKRKERRRNTFPSTLNFNKLAQFHLELLLEFALIKRKFHKLPLLLECRMYSSGTDLSPRSGINKAFEEFSCLSFARQKF